ncbi:protein FAM32A-like [Varroa jacobsoni]|uniref:protein FAM32A-like n=1 Tax=Varroa jacobsoni TaxID=62625 RepID=UPI000BF5FC38|nr:protein FAM32A-like [Varroa jacobsoni]
MSEYFVSEGALKLNGFKKKKKKSKKSKDLKNLEAHMSRTDHHSTDEDKSETVASSSSLRQSKEGPRLITCQLTKAQRTFKKMQEKKKLERIMEKASKSHRQRVEEFNAKLDNLSEHYDIPKVSWTK